MSEALPRVKETDGRVLPASAGESTEAEEDVAVAAAAEIFCDVCRLDFDVVVIVVVVEVVALAVRLSAPLLDALIAASAAAAALKPLAASSRSAVEPGVSVLETRGTWTSK